MIARMRKPRISRATKSDKLLATPVSQEGGFTPAPDNSTSCGGKPTFRAVSDKLELVLPRGDERRSRFRPLRFSAASQIAPFPHTGVDAAQHWSFVGQQMLFVSQHWSFVGQQMLFVSQHWSFVGQQMHFVSQL